MISFLSSFPLNGHDLLSAGCPKGKLLSVVMKHLKEFWKESDFEMESQDLLEKLPLVVKEIEEKGMPTDNKQDLWKNKRKRHT